MWERPPAVMLLLRCLIEPEHRGETPLPQNSLSLPDWPIRAGTSGLHAIIRHSLVYKAPWSRDPLDAVHRRCPCSKRFPSQGFGLA